MQKGGPARTMEVMSVRFSRRQFFPLAAAAMASCARRNDAKVLNIYLWAEYLPDDVVRDFEKEHGCRVQVDTYNSNEEMMAKAATGNCGYDLVCPSQYAVSQMASQGLLAELDHGALPGRRNLDVRFAGMRADPEGRWAIPYLGASTGIGYRKSAVEPPPQRWADLFDPAFLEKVRGKLSILDDAREASAIALLALGLSPNTTDPGEIAKAGDLLRRQKPSVACYDSEAFEDKLASGICSIVQGYAGDFVAVMQDDAELDFFLPAEGSVFNMDCLCVLRESPRKEQAHQFLEYILRPAVAARISQGTGYPTANAAAAGLIPAALRDHPCFRIPQGDQLIMLEDPGVAVKDLFTQAWESVKQS